MLSQEKIGTHNYIFLRKKKKMIRKFLFYVKSWSQVRLTREDTPRRPSYLLPKHCCGFS